MIEVQKADVVVPVILLPYGTVFTCDSGIGVRVDDGWIIVEDCCVTAYTDGQYQSFKESFGAVTPIDMMVKMIIKRKDP